MGRVVVTVVEDLDVMEVGSRIWEDDVDVDESADDEDDFDDESVDVLVEAVDLLDLDMLDVMM